MHWLEMQDRRDLVKQVEEKLSKKFSMKNKQNLNVICSKIPYQLVKQTLHSRRIRGSVIRVDKSRWRDFVISTVSGLIIA